MKCLKDYCTIRYSTKFEKKNIKKFLFYSRFLVKRTVLKSITVLLSSNSYTEPQKLYL